MNGEKRLLTVREAARYLGMSHRTLWDWAAKGQLPVTRFGRKVLFDRIKLDDLIKERTRPVTKTY